mgnify:CR=1 FL=1
MRKRFLALILVLLLFSLPVRVLADGADDAPKADTDEEQFGPGAVVERDESGVPVTVNGYPVREVTAGINLRSNRAAYEYPVWFADYPFWQSATQYDGNLAVMSLALALSANRAMNPSEDVKAWFDPSLHLEKYLTDAGFSDIRKDDYSKETSMYTISMAMGSRRMEREGEEPFTLIAIGVCGGGYGNEWQSNMTPGQGAIHQGFLSASRLVIDRLAGYILTNGIKGNIKVWISGFSRAAAVSNVTAGLLVRDGVFPKENVFAYTFATPAAVCNAPRSGYENIFNILNPMDIVPQVMPSDWNFARFGTDLFIPVTEFSSTGDTYTHSRAAIAREAFGIEANYSPALNLRMRLLLSMIMDVAENREQYNAHLQPAVVGVMKNGNASNLLSTVRSLLLTVKDKGSAGRMNVDTLVNYVSRVFGNVLRRGILPLDVGIFAVRRGTATLGMRGVAVRRGTATLGVGVDAVYRGSGVMALGVGIVALRRAKTLGYAVFASSRAASDGEIFLHRQRARHRAACLRETAVVHPLARGEKYVARASDIV